MKVVIVGAGVGGLLTYLALQKQLSSSCPSLTVKVYESHASPSSTTSHIGGGLNLAPNGLRAIGAVLKKAVSHIQANGHPGAVAAMRNSSGWFLGNMRAGHPDHYAGLGRTMVRRAVVHQALLDEVPDGAVVWGKKVVLVKETDEGVQVEFADGETQMADLVIGADGVRSVVRECIFGNRYQATYFGLTGVGGFIHVERLPERLRKSLSTESVSMTFGPQGLFGYSMISPPTAPKHEAEIQWWSVYESLKPSPRSLDPSVVRDELLARHRSWKSPYDTTDAKVYESIIRLGCDSGSSSSSTKPFMILPRYVVPRLPKWTTPSGKIILIGDAAHAMLPDAGQGVSCALEDAVALGVLLRHYLVIRQLGLSETLAKTAKAYEGIRMKRVEEILDMAEQNANTKKVGPWRAWMRDCFFAVLCHMPESVNDSIFSHDVEAEVVEYLAEHY